MAASQYFTEGFGRLIPKVSTCCFKKEYLLKLEENIGTAKAQVEIKELPIKCQGRPFTPRKNQSSYARIY